MKKSFVMLCAFIALVVGGSLYVYANPNPSPEPDGLMCQSKAGVSAYVRVLSDNRCCGYFYNSTSRTVEINWTITAIDKVSGCRVEVASGRVSIPAGRTSGNTCDTYWCGGSDYRDRSYSIDFNLCN